MRNQLPQVLTMLNNGQKQSEELNLVISQPNDDVSLAKVKESQDWKYFNVFTEIDNYGQHKTTKRETHTKVQLVANWSKNNTIAPQIYQQIQIVHHKSSCYLPC